MCVYVPIVNVIYIYRVYKWQHKPNWNMYIKKNILIFSFSLLEEICTKTCMKVNIGHIPIIKNPDGELKLELS